jgi:hypothetical protein
MGFYQLQPAPVYPHRTLGIVLLILGILMLIGGIAAAAYCSLSILGVCLDYPYAGAGVLLALVGVILLIVGIVLMVLKGSAPTAPPQPLYAAPPGQDPPPGYYPPAAGPVYSPPAAAPAERYCPACGTGNARAAGFCTRCGKPLPRPS